MNTKSKIVILLAGVAVSATAAVSAYADNGPGKYRHHGQQQARGMGPGAMAPGGRGEGPRIMFQRADTDNSGTVTLEEFTAQSPFDLASADANSDGNVNVDELTDAMLREMLKRRAERVIERFDTDNDGQISTAEIESHQQEMFARFDIDGSGAIEEDEMRSRRGRGEGRGDRGEYRRHHGGGRY